MAKRARAELSESRVLTADQIHQGIELLTRRINDVENFAFSSVRERWAPAVSARGSSIDDTLAKLEGAHFIFFCSVDGQHAFESADRR